MTSILSFHQNVAFMQSLAPFGGGGSSETSSTAARNYSIRRCLRNLQPLLLTEELKLILKNGHCAMDGSVGGGSVRSIATSDDENPLAIQHHPTYDQVTQDLITLLTLDFDGINDPSIARIFLESIVCRVMDLLDEAPHLGAPHLRALFHHVLNHLHVDGLTSGKNDDDHDSDPQCHLHQLLDLMNRHVTNHEHLHAVFTNDHELFVAIHTLLRFNEKLGACFQNPVPPSIELAIFINSIIEYWVFLCRAPNDKKSDNEGDSAIRDGIVNDVQGWVQMQFLQQQHNYSVPELLQQDVNAYISRVESYGMTLIESTLCMLEDSVSTWIPGHSSHHPEDNNDGPPRPNAEPQHLTGDEDLDVTVLKYATLATTFLVAIQNTNLSLAYPIANSTLPLSRSLWREYVNFVIRRLSITAGPGNMIINGDDAYSFTSRAVDMTLGGSDGLDLSMVATDTLWRLAQYHYPTPPTNRYRRSHNKYEDIPMILVTILCLWKYTTTFWNDDAIDWMKHILQDDFPSTTSSGKDLRQGLYSVILAQTYFPSHDTQSYAKEPIDMLKTLLLHDFEEPDKKLLPNESSFSNQEEDPWKVWVKTQISNGDS